MANSSLSWTPRDLAAGGDHFGDEQAGDDAVFLRDVAADGEAGGLFAADGDLVGDDELADVLEADGGFVERDLVVVGEGVDEVGGGDAFGDAVAPAAGFDEVVEEQGDDVVGLDEGAVGVDDAEAVGVAVGGDAEGRADLFHFAFGVAEQVVVGLGCMAAEEDVAVVVDGFDGDAGVAEQVGRVAAARAPEGIVDDLDAGLGDGLEVDELGEALEEGGLDVGWSRSRWPAQARTLEWRRWWIGGRRWRLRFVW